MRSMKWHRNVMPHYIEKPVNLDDLNEIPKYIKEERKVKRVELKEFKFGRYPKN
ncbi:hypothetical protein [Macrococcus sp. DPC7161]|uniref:hypothetical protein n=1 Tax=Macrococcus sp. DPC7161 TaxID=2507060 RepID=UPI0013E900D9|nr:hypothetical protein [Macrococcus sp. DPC7161]